MDFVDGTMFHGQELYHDTGEFVDHAEWLSDYTYLQIYYQSIRARTTTISRLTTIFGVGIPIGSGAPNIFFCNIR